ncbi:hypothetical protein P2O69_16880 [Escherichia coli]
MDNGIDWFFNFLYVKLVIINISRDGTVIVALADKSLYIGTGALRVQYGQDMDISGSGQFHSREQSQRAKARQATGSRFLAHPLQFIFQRVDPCATIMIADDNTVDLLPHVSQKPVSGSDA